MLLSVGTGCETLTLSHNSVALTGSITVLPKLNAILS